MSGVDRIALAGAFWERGEPLTDEVWATRQYVDQMRARYSTYTPPQRVGENRPEPDWQQIAAGLAESLLGVTTAVEMAPSAVGDLWPRSLMRSDAARVLKIYDQALEKSREQG